MNSTVRNRGVDVHVASLQVVNSDEPPFSDEHLIVVVGRVEGQTHVCEVQLRVRGVNRFFDMCMLTDMPLPEDRGVPQVQLNMLQQLGSPPMAIPVMNTAAARYSKNAGKSL